MVKLDSRIINNPGARVTQPQQQQLDKLTQEVREIKQALSTIAEYKEVVAFFDIFLEPIAEAEKELKSGFEEKLQAGKHGGWTMEVSLFLNVCGMEDLVTRAVGIRGTKVAASITRKE